MISESWYWKDSLKKQVRFLNRKLHQRVWRCGSIVRLEEAIMVSCYIVRKLAEAKKIVQAFHQPIPLRRFPAGGALIDLNDSRKIDELYRLDDGADMNKPLSYVVNQVIHSYVFDPLFERPGRIYGVIFNSDHSKARQVYMVSLATLTEALGKIANIYISRASYVRVGPNGEWKVDLQEATTEA